MKNYENIRVFYNSDFKTFLVVDFDEVEIYDVDDQPKNLAQLFDDFDSEDRHGVAYEFIESYKLPKHQEGRYYQEILLNEDYKEINKNEVENISKDFSNENSEYYPD